MPSAVGVGYEVERMGYQIDKDRFIYLAKKPYEKIMKDKRINITGILFVDSWIPKLIIDYEVENPRGIYTALKKGTMELNDIGPRPQKPKKDPKPIRRVEDPTKTKDTKPLHTKTKIKN